MPDAPEPPTEDRHDIAAQLADLRADLASACAEIAELRGQLRGPDPDGSERGQHAVSSQPEVCIDSNGADSADGAEHPTDRAQDRRSMLRTVGKVAVGAAVAGVATLAADTSPAAAADGNNVVLGSNFNQASSLTALFNSALTGTTAFQFDDAATLWNTTASATLGVRGTRLTNSIYAFNNVASGTAIVGESQGTNGIGVGGVGSVAGLQGVCANVNGAGVYALTAAGGTGFLTGSTYGFDGRNAVVVLRCGGFLTSTTDIVDSYYSVGDVVALVDGTMRYCVEKPGGVAKFRTVASPASAGSLHLLTSPVRFVDSTTGRRASGTASGARAITLAGQVQDGQTIPADALAIMASITTYPSNLATFSSAGYCSVGPDNGGAGAVTTTFAIGDGARNGLMVASLASGRISAFTNLAHHITVDVIGYYR